MNKKLTLILLSSIFMSGLAARPTLQNVREAIPTLKDVRNTVTVRNACRVAGGLLCFYAGSRIGFTMHRTYVNKYNLPFSRIPLPPVRIALGKLGVLVKEGYFRASSEEQFRLSRELRVLPTAAAFAGAYCGAKLGGSLYDSVTKRYQQEAAN